MGPYASCNLALTSPAVLAGKKASSAKVTCLLRSPTGYARAIASANVAAGTAKSGRRLSKPSSKTGILPEASRKSGRTAVTSITIARPGNRTLKIVNIDGR